MKATTRSILVAALKQDGDFAPEQISEVIATLDQKQTRDKDPPSMLLTQAEVSRILKCSRWSTKRLVEAGYLRPIQLRGLTRYKRTDVEQLLVNGTGSARNTRDPDP